MRVKRFSVLAMLYVLLAGAPALVLGFAHEARAATAPGCESDGPGGGLWGIMTRHADVQRVRDKAYTRIIKQSDSSLAMTCFDKALALSARLGAIFSDAPPAAAIPAAIPAVFGNGVIYNTWAGMGLSPQGRPNTLANAYGRVVTPALSAYLSDPGNFGASITGQMGVTVSGQLTALVNNVTGFMTGGPIKGALDSLINIYNAGSISASVSINIGGVFSLSADFTSIAASVAGPVVTVVTTVAQVYNAVSSTIQDKMRVLNDTMGVVNAFSAGFADILNAGSALGSAQASLAGFSWSSIASGAAGRAVGCLHAESAWAGNGTVAGVTGSGPTPQMPYFTYGDFVSQATAGVSPAIDAEAAAPYNTAILANGWYDMAADLLSPDTTTLRSWPAAPVLPASISSRNLVTLMP